MPIYKFVGNKILTTVREPPARHRSVRVPLRLPRLQRARAEGNSTSRRRPTTSTSTPRSSSQLHATGKRIVEIPIPTYYGDEISHVNGLKYAAQVVTDVAVYRLARLGLTPGRARRSDARIRRTGVQRGVQPRHPGTDRRSVSRAGAGCRGRTSPSGGRAARSRSPGDRCGGGRDAGDRERTSTTSSTGGPGPRGLPHGVERSLRRWSWPPTPSSIVREPCSAAAARWPTS